jgi:hypothetical protein
MQREAAKATYLDSLPRGQRVAHEVKQVLDRKLNVFGRQVFLFSGNRFYEFRFSHYSAFSGCDS